MQNALWAMLAVTKQKCCWLFVALVCHFSVFGALATTTSLQTEPADTLWQHSTQFKTVGEGHFRYLFWSLYDAQLKTQDGSFQSVENNKPLALTLTYQREISRDDFVEATLDQWRHLFGEVSPIQTLWGQQLRQIWRDVKQGDQLSCVVDDSGHAHFYLNQQFIGQISEPLFAEQFLAIWLDERTSAPTLRRQLLGQ